MPEISEQELQRLIDNALRAHEARIEARLRDQLEREQEKAKGEILATALNEGSQLYLDPGTGYEFALVPLDKIDFNPLSRRTPEDLDPESAGMKTLIKEIKQRSGLLRPLLAYRKGDRYMLVKGARRLAALKAMGEELTHVYILPAKPPMDSEERWVNGY